MKRFKFICLSALLAGLALAAPVKELDQKHASAAAEGGLAEVQFGQLAEKKASNPKVKAFAQKMVKDHSAANEELKGVAGRNQIQLPVALNAEHQAAYKKLNGLSGAAFDKAYIEGQVKDHEAAYKVFSEGAKDSQNQDLKKFFDKHQGHIKMHLDTARSLAR
jgi:putative membrane protein